MGTISIDYYFTPQSPWTYLGHERFAAIAKAHGARVNVLPVDLGKVFPVSGGLPLGKRAPQRQAYRLVDLARFSRHLDIPLNPTPKLKKYCSFPPSISVLSKALKPLSWLTPPTSRRSPEPGDNRSSSAPAAST